MVMSVLAWRRPRDVANNESKNVCLRPTSSVVAADDGRGT
jgi:hypothetical protein